MTFYGKLDYLANEVRNNERRELTLELALKCKNEKEKISFFDMSDDLFYRISLIGFLVVFSSMVFFLTKNREKKVNNISKISITEQIKFLKH